MDDPIDDEESPGSSSFRRIWKRRNGAQGSSQLALKTMAVLYDAGQPLSREDIAKRLLGRLDPYARDYLEAWALRRLQQKAQYQARRRGTPVAFVKSRRKATPLGIVQQWLTEVFAGRIHQQSLIRDPDGRYRPGVKAPTVQTIDGKLKRFTPEARRELEQADHDRGRTHLVELEFQRATSALDFTSPDARVQLVTFLIRHLFATTRKGPFSEWQLKAEFKHLIHIADTPAIKEALLRLAIDLLYTRA